ncbi:MAG: helix-turn-helix transcriptional regulator [Clostridia bacterium]|nr:helix-turn-helix transcriptional regulator [Clostridia bacterium]
MSENLNNKATRGSISQIILTALSSGSKYGYEICKDIEKITNGKLILKQPSLYSSLRRMEEQNLITSYWEDSSLGGKRHYYSLTEKGKEIYEKNKDIWNDKKELINNLPENLQFKDASIKNDDNEFNKEETSTYIANQENLFNLTRSSDNVIKKIDANTINQEDEDKNKSFFQFDFFEQNIKFVKENSSNKNQEISSFSNKFSQMDNHSAEIEPDEIELNSYNETFVKKEETQTKPILHSIELKEIKRQDVFSNEKIIEEIDNVKTNKNNGVLNDMNNNETNEVNLFEHILGNKEETVEPISFTKIQSEEIEIKRKEIDFQKNTNTEEISWENNNSSDAKNPIFENKDYKGLIGKLYNNSQLKDPYEQNKYHTFKEIFPSSQLKEKEKQTEVYKESALDAIVESSTNSNIDCDDIKMLNNLYNLQGISIKIHSDIENKKQNKVYTDKNKLNMICSWIITILMLAEVLGAFFILKNQNLIARGQTIIYYLGVALTLSYCIIFTLENIFDRFKLSIIERKFNKILITRLLLFIIMVVLIFALNLAFGMKNLMQINFLSYWLIPTLLSSNVVIQAIVYELLYKSKAFNS